MNRSGIRPGFSPMVLEHLEQRLAPAASIFENQVINLYRFALNRSPEPEGLQVHVQSLESGTSLGQVAESIFNSDERWRSVITGFYRELLNREPDAEGMAAHLRAAKNGATEEEILATFLSSNEYVGADVPNETYVDFLYQQALGRAGDERGRAAHLVALQNGATRYQVALSFLSGTENDATQIRSFYHSILGRVGAEGEVQGWVNRLAKPGFDQRDALVAFLGSAEGNKAIGSDIVFGTFPQNEGWWFDNMGLSSLTVKPFGGPTDGQEQVQALANQIRAVETFSNPNNMGQIDSQLQKEDYPKIKFVNNSDAKTTGTFGASAYSEDLRNTPGAFQVDLANIGQFDPNKNNDVFGEWLGVAGTFKKPYSTDVEFAFSQQTLHDFLGIEVDANGLITSIAKEAASVFLGNESVAMDPGFDPLNNPLIGQHIDSLKREQLSLYLAGRSPADANLYMIKDVRVAPQAVVDVALGLQYQASKSYTYGVMKKYATHVEYKDTFAKAQALFGSTLKITSNQTAFGVQSGQQFWSRFNGGFIAGGAYVSGESAMFNLFKGIVDADQNGTGTWTIQQPNKPDIVITFIKVKDGATAADKVFTVDKTPTNVTPNFPSIFHYGASLSIYSIDDVLDDPASWGVTGRSSNLGYSRISASQTQDGGGILPSGSGAFSYQYKGLENAQTVQVSGPGSFKLVPVPTNLGDVVTVDNSGYNSEIRANNSQKVLPGQKIDMSAYGLKIEDAYPDMYYVDTRIEPFRVAHVSDTTFDLTSWGLYMYYVNGANGDLAKATEAINQYLVSWQEPFKYSYRVIVDSTNVLGHPTSAAQFAANFIMDPPPPPLQGSGVVDASSLTGSLRLQTDTSIIKVLLGQGPNLVDAGSLGTGVQYVVNPAMAPGEDTTVFRNLRLGTDKIDLTGFGPVTHLAAKVVSAFDNKTGPALSTMYPQYTNTAEVSFTAGGKSYQFLVLVSGKTQIPEGTLVANILSSVVTA